ncbi:MAG TPA: DnaT-like ssDNA-binding domain-containing protein [SAR86 cluster bacterium]|nr:DnaT-like ssDNA-binding domain-containing protein [SAR86 cluster bacterium]HJM59787.1 DnaT-like ssDNA-binding domain-containing protein [SAR86 cluster bacterium]|tara:strand:- start:9592 stop:10656 length:1065 start_codon:yes stop_codon:yes gene_type:complete
MPDSRFNFSKDIANSIGLPEAILLETFREDYLIHNNTEGFTTNNLLTIFSFWSDQDLTEYLQSLTSKGLISAKKIDTETYYSFKETGKEKRKNTHIENAWKPENELLDQLNEYGIPQEFAYSQLDDFKQLNQERNDKDKSWNIKFLRFVIKKWRQEEILISRKKKRKSMYSDWLPDEEAREILIRSGIEEEFINKEIPEFILYWTEKKEESDIWNSKFISHIRRQWSRFQNVNENNDTPFKIDSKWLPNEDFYDVLALTDISKEFADSTIAEFILYWKETGQSHNSWNSKFLQHVKFQWQKYNQNYSTQNQNLMEKRIESSWDITNNTKTSLTKKQSSKETKKNFQKLKEKHQI